ncbi:unnamed protein product [Amoebophrya sp. A25]|nr:unnamed protein product [Amoebophrya sp. A25]|eukprot:GSA25T00010477001.1
MSQPVHDASFSGPAVLQMQLHQVAMTPAPTENFCSTQFLHGTSSLSASASIADVAFRNAVLGASHGGMRDGLVYPAEDRSFSDSRALTASSSRCTPMLKTTGTTNRQAKEPAFSSAVSLLFDDGSVRVLRTKTLEPLFVLEAAATGAPFTRFALDCFSRRIVLLRGNGGELEVRDLDVCRALAKREARRRAAVFGCGTLPTKAAVTTTTEESEMDEVLPSNSYTILSGGGPASSAVNGRQEVFQKVKSMVNGVTSSSEENFPGRCDADVEGPMGLGDTVTVTPMTLLPNSPEILGGNLSSFAYTHADAERAYSRKFGSMQAARSHETNPISAADATTSFFVTPSLVATAGGGGFIETARDSRFKDERALEHRREQCGGSESSSSFRADPASKHGSKSTRYPASSGSPEDEATVAGFGGSSKTTNAPSTSKTTVATSGVNHLELTSLSARTSVTLTQRGASASATSTQCHHFVVKTRQDFERHALPLLHANLRGAGLLDKTRNNGLVSHAACKALLMRRGQFSNRLRPLYWVFLLRLPFREDALREDADGSFVDEQLQAPCSPDNVVRVVLSLEERLSRSFRRWCPALFSQQGSADVVNDFIAALLHGLGYIPGSGENENNLGYELHINVLFELLLSFFLLYARDWFWAGDGSCPESVSIGFDGLVADHLGPTRYENLSSCTRSRISRVSNDVGCSKDETGQSLADGGSRRHEESVAATLLWPLIRTLGLAAIESRDWCYVFDHCVVHWHRPWMLEAFLLAWLMDSTQHESVCSTSLVIPRVSNRTRKPTNLKKQIDVKAVVASMYRLQEEVGVYLEAASTASAEIPLVPLPSCGSSLPQFQRLPQTSIQLVDPHFMAVPRGAAAARGTSLGPTLLTTTGGKSRGLDHSWTGPGHLVSPSLVKEDTTLLEISVSMCDDLIQSREADISQLRQLGIVT